MPVISRFYGIIIKMYFQQSEHQPPHIHAIYGEYVGLFDIRSRIMTKGDLPPRAQALVEEWLKLYSSELQNMWEGQKIDKLPPLE